MTATAQDGQGFVRTAFGEFIKQYFTYDVSDRVSIVYEAPRNATTGTPCSKTTYTYWGATTKVKLVLEDKDAWDTAWEV
jgi:hypothetical protein